MIIIKPDTRIYFIGFNIEGGKIVAEKIYYKRVKTEAPKIDNEFVQQLLSSAKGLRFFRRNCIL